MKPESQKALIAAVLVVVFGLLFLWKSHGKAIFLTDETEEQASFVLTEAAETVSESESPGIVVYVSGEVKNPGVYELPINSRVCDALMAAGGLTENALDSLVNLAEVLTDGEMIRFPEKTDASAGTAVLSDGLVNLNTAGRDDLMTLPGIGEARADAIISYRNENGSFRSTEELMNVPGIGETLFDRLKNRIKI